MESTSEGGRGGRAQEERRAPAREAAPGADLEFVRARGPSREKEKDKIYTRTYNKFSLFLGRIHDASRSRDWKIEKSRALYEAQFA